MNLDSAKLGGRKSQDPYALVYLLGKGGLTFFQVGNHETDVFLKNIEPKFNKKFQFNVSLIIDPRMEDVCTLA